MFVSARVRYCGNEGGAWRRSAYLSNAVKCTLNLNGTASTRGREGEGGGWGWGWGEGLTVRLLESPTVTSKREQYGIITHDAKCYVH